MRPFSGPVYNRNIDESPKSAPQGPDAASPVKPRSASRRHLTLLEQLTDLVGRAEDPQEGLEGVVRMLAAATDCEVCSLYAYDPKTGNLNLAATQGLPARSIGRVAMHHDEGLVGLVVTEQKALAFEDAFTHPRFKFFPETGEEKYHSFVGTPVGTGAGMLGVLVLQSRRRRRFSNEDISLLRSVAGQVRSVMVNAHLADQLQREEAERDHYRRGMSRAIRRLEAYEAEEARHSSPEPTEALVHLSGLGAAPGFGIGTVHRLLPLADIASVEVRPGVGPEAERDRFDGALASAIEEVERTRVYMTDLVPEVGGELFDALRLMIDDPAIRRRVGEEIANGLAAEASVKIVIDEYVERFESVEDEYLRERAVDVRDVGQRILRQLIGVAECNVDLTENSVLVAAELTLSDLATVDHARLRGIVTATGGVTSHAAILTKSLGIPTVVGAEGVFEASAEGDLIIVDGNTGTVYVRPSEELVSEYRRLGSEYDAFQRDLENLRQLPAQTIDGHRIAVMANVGLVGELDLVDRFGAEGVGLYRTEFAFLSYRNFPTEDEQLRLYKRMFAGMEGKPVTIRTLDLGGDKYPAFARRVREANPFLGFRSIRVSLETESLFSAQLRAILRAAGTTPLRILFPMVTSVEELRRVKEIFAECIADLALEGVTPPPGMELGAMIEVPAAVLRAEQIMREVDFVSIGTNDLIQYTLAVDRDNRHIAAMFEPLHPAVLHSIAQVVRAGRATGRSVSICGEMAGNPLCTVLLVGLGVDELSMSPLYIPVVKKIIRTVSIVDAKRVADEVLRLDTVEEVKGCLFGFMRELGLLELVEAFS
ncbi:MAG: phosphotransferase system enzyme I (PtsP) [Candidatus Binatia bacterium]